MKIRIRMPLHGLLLDPEELLIVHEAFPSPLEGKRYVRNHILFSTENRVKYCDFWKTTSKSNCFLLKIEESSQNP